MSNHMTLYMNHCHICMDMLLYLTKEKIGWAFQGDLLNLVACEFHVGITNDVGVGYISYIFPDTSHTLAADVAGEHFAAAAKLLHLLVVQLNHFIAETAVDFVIRIRIIQMSD